MFVKCNKESSGQPHLNAISPLVFNLLKIGIFIFADGKERQTWQQ